MGEELLEWIKKMFDHLINSFKADMSEMKTEIENMRQENRKMKRELDGYKKDHLAMSYWIANLPYNDNKNNNTPEWSSDELESETDRRGIE